MNRIFILGFTVLMGWVAGLGAEEGTVTEFLTPEEAVAVLAADVAGRLPEVIAFAEKSTDPDVAAALAMFPGGLAAWGRKFARGELQRQLREDGRWRPVPLFYRLAARQNVAASGTGLTDRRLLQALLSLYRAGAEEWTEQVHSAKRSFFGVFPPELLRANVKTLLEPYLTGRLDFTGSDQLAFPREWAGLFPELFQACFAKNWETVNTIDPSQFREIAYRLRFNVKFGDVKAREKLIAMFLACPAPGQDPARNWRRDTDTFEYLIDALCDLGTPEALKAVLSRFHEEIGGPAFKDVPDCVPPQRMTVLRRLAAIYPDDPFWKKYARFLDPARDDDLESRDYATDAEIGGEAGVTELFRGLRQWAKERLGYEMSLDGATPHIRSCYGRESAIF